MHKLLVAGAGKIGSLVACLLQAAGDYEITLIDVDFQGYDVARIKAAYPTLKTVKLNVNDADAMRHFLRDNPLHGVISCLPFFCNVNIAALAKEFNLNYFDLTEDIEVTAAIKKIAAGAATAFVPQCGLAPGFIGIAAHSLMRRFSEVEKVELRVGALPTNVNNALHYALTWSTDGLINEYANPCQVIENGKMVLLPPLQGLETLEIDGITYEAFNTSGGLGSLPELYQHKVQHMNYKTIRYPGHCEKMLFLMDDLKLAQDRPMLKLILERALPKTYQDVVVIYVGVTGTAHGEYLEENYVKKIYPSTIANINWSAIQVTTAASLCSVVDLVLNQTQKMQGFVFQENFTLDEVLQNRFGKYYSLKV